MQRDLSVGGSCGDCWYEALEQRVMLDSAFAAVGYYNEPDLFNGGTRQVMYSLEGEFEDVSNTLTYRLFTSADENPIEQTASVILDETTGYFEVGLFGNGETQTGFMAGPSGSRTGWLSDPAEDGQPEETSWWIEHSGSIGPNNLVHHQKQRDAFRGFVYSRDPGSTAGRTDISNAFFNVDTAQGEFTGFSGVIPSNISFEGAFRETAQPNKYQWSLGQTDPAWLYISGNGTQYVAVQFGGENESAWVSVGMSRQSLTGIAPTAEDLAGEYRLLRESESVTGVHHPWATAGDDGVLTLTYDPTNSSNVPMGTHPAQFISDRTGERYSGFWNNLDYGSNNTINVFFEPTPDQVDLDRYALSLFVGGFNTPVMLAQGTLYGVTGRVPQVQMTRLMAVRVDSASAASGPGEGSDPNGEVSNEPPPVSLPTDADEFIEYFQNENPEGLAIGNEVAAILGDAVPTNTYEHTPWGAENHWFQTSNGDVWSLWHGGPVHLLANGEHMWTLTNLAEAAGLVGEMDFEPGSMSGVLTTWRAFSIQGIVDGQLVSLWWSPESALHEWGNQDNGWVLTPFTTDILFDADTDQRVELLPRFRAFTDTQHNGRYAFDPRGQRTEIEFGMSVVLVDVNNNVYAATFSTANNLLFEVPEGIANVWRLERISDVPGVANHKLLSTIDEISFDFVVRAGV